MSYIEQIIGKVKMNEIFEQGIDITIAADNDFYSQREQVAEFLLIES